jgi:hypothetical protein
MPNRSKCRCSIRCLQHVQGPGKVAGCSFVRVRLARSVTGSRGIHSPSGEGAGLGTALRLVVFDRDGQAAATRRRLERAEAATAEAPSPQRAGPGQHIRASVGGSLPDCGERTRPSDHRRDPDGQQPGQRIAAAASLPRVRDLDEEIENVLAAGSRMGADVIGGRASLVADDG